jgi:hypothetical protein
VKFWRARIVYSWYCESCHRGEDLITTGDAEPIPTLLPDNWYAVVSPTGPRTSIFCSQECMLKHFDGALIVGYA